MTQQDKGEDWQCKHCYHRDSEHMPTADRICQHPCDCPGFETTKPTEQDKSELRGVVAEKLCVMAGHPIWFKKDKPDIWEVMIEPYHKDADQIISTILDEIEKLPEMEIESERHTTSCNIRPCTCFARIERTRNQLRADLRQAFKLMGRK